MGLPREKAAPSCALDGRVVSEDACPPRDTCVRRTRMQMITLAEEMGRWAEGDGALRMSSHIRLIAVSDRYVCLQLLRRRIGQRCSREPETAAASLCAAVQRCEQLA